MSYDCSVTKRKGCNYCLKSKSIQTFNDNKWWIDEDRKVLESVDGMTYKRIEINYCPVCGREL